MHTYAKKGEQKLLDDLRGGVEDNRKRQGQLNRQRKLATKNQRGVSRGHVSVHKGQKLQCTRIMSRITPVGRLQNT